VEAVMRCGEVVNAALAAGIARAVVGATPRDVSRAVQNVIEARGAWPVLLGYEQRKTALGAEHARREGSETETLRFPAAACVCVNEQVLHAVPSEVPLRAGDIVTIDTAVRKRATTGWHADAARTIVVGDDGSERARMHARLAELAREACAVAIDYCVSGAKWSEVVGAVKSHVGSQGGSLIAGYHGHGIGEKLHQAPSCWFAGLPHEERDGSLRDFVLRPGMVVCIEPIVSASAKAPTLVQGNDGWTMLTRDRSSAAFEERCVVVGWGRARVLAGEF
jgi:methionyl aminopeptidase